MKNKTIIAIVCVLGGMLWVYVFGMSKTKFIDMWFLGMAAMIMCHGLEKLVQDHDAAQARLFGTMANLSMFITIGLFIVGFVSR